MKIVQDFLDIQCKYFLVVFQYPFLSKIFLKSVFCPKGRGYHHYPLNASDQNRMQHKGKNLVKKKFKTKTVVNVIKQMPFFMIFHFLQLTNFVRLSPVFRTICPFLTYNKRQFSKNHFCETFTFMVFMFLYILSYLSSEIQLCFMDNLSFFFSITERQSKCNLWVYHGNFIRWYLRTCDENQIFVEKKIKFKQIE